MGQFYLSMRARGLRIIYPVGLEKLVPSVPSSSAFGGIQTLTGIGAYAGMVCVPNADVYTEIDALYDLFEVDAYHLASGGWGGAEGAVTLGLEGSDEAITRCLEVLAAQVKGEPPLSAVKSDCQTCQSPCSFKGKSRSDLPAYVQ